MASSIIASLASRSIRSVRPVQLLRPTASALFQSKFTPIRSYATERKDPAAAAASIINLFPGETLAQKAGSVLLSSSIAAYLISKEIYLLDGEVFEVIVLFTAWYIWYAGAKDGAAEYFNERQNTVKRILNEAREQHKSVVKERIAHIGKLADVVDVTKALFEISKDIAKLEGETYELKQKVAFTNEVKSVLDSWVRHEAGVRERQQKLMTEAIISKVKSELADPRLQTQILQQTLQDVERITRTA